MTVLEDLQDLESRVVSRMRELAPLVAEYRELERVARQLGLDVEKAAGRRAAGTRPTQSKTARKAAGGGARVASSAVGPKRRRKRSGGSGRRRPLAAPGERQQQVLEAVTRQPGITVRELGAQLGVDPTALYRSVRRLEHERTIRKDGPALQPV